MWLCVTAEVHLASSPISLIEKLPLPCIFKMKNTCSYAPEQTYLYMHKCKHTVITSEAPAVGCPSPVDEAKSILHLWLSELYSMLSLPLGIKPCNVVIICMFLSVFWGLETDKVTFTSEPDHSLTPTHWPQTKYFTYSNRVVDWQLCSWKQFIL